MEHHPITIWVLLGAFTFVLPSIIFIYLTPRIDELFKLGLKRKAISFLIIYITTSSLFQACFFYLAGGGHVFSLHAWFPLFFAVIIIRAIEIYALKNKKYRGF